MPPIAKAKRELQAGVARGVGASSAGVRSLQRRMGLADAGLGNVRDASQLSVSGQLAAGISP